METATVLPKVKSNEISLLTGILCILVVFIHVCSAAITGLEKTSIQLIVLYIPWKSAQFVVQGFIFLSALKICRKYKETRFDYKTYGSFIKNRITIIYIPYAIWVMIYYIYFWNRGYFPFSKVDYIKYLLLGNLASPFYFIVIIMQFYFFMPLWLTIIRRFKPVGIIIIAMLITIFMMNNFPDIISKLSAGTIDFKYNDRIFTSYLIYWMFGCYAGIYLEEFKLLVKRYFKFIVALTLLLLTTYIVLTYSGFIGVKYFNNIETIRLFYCLGAIMSIYGACIYLGEKDTIANVILYDINKSSYYIYLSHCLVLNKVEEICYNLGINGIDRIFIIKMVFVYLVPIIGSHMYIAIKSKAFQKSLYC